MSINNKIKTSVWKMLKNNTYIYSPYRRRLPHDAQAVCRSRPQAERARSLWWPSIAWQSDARWNKCARVALSQHLTRTTARLTCTRPGDDTWAVWCSSWVCPWAEASTCSRTKSLPDHPCTANRTACQWPIDPLHKIRQSIFHHKNLFIINDWLTIFRLFFVKSKF